MNESCKDHGGLMTEHRWIGLLSGRQDKGLFWCEGGRHYVEVYRTRIYELLYKVVGR